MTYYHITVRIEGKSQRKWVRSTSAGDTFQIVGRDGEWSGHTIIFRALGPRAKVTTELENGEKRVTWLLNHGDVTSQNPARMNLHYGELE